MRDVCLSADDQVIFSRGFLGVFIPLSGASPSVMECLHVTKGEELFRHLRLPSVALFSPVISLDKSGTSRLTIETCGELHKGRDSHRPRGLIGHSIGHSFQKALTDSAQKPQRPKLKEKKKKKKERAARKQKSKITYPFSSMDDMYIHSIRMNGSMYVHMVHIWGRNSPSVE